MVFSFDGVRVDPDLFEVRKDGAPIPLEPQAFDVLVYLLRHRDRVVAKEELMDAVWGGRFVSETAVTSRIKQVRRALGDDGQAQRLVRTLHGRGYRFVGELSGAEPPEPVAGQRAESAPAAVPEQHVHGGRVNNNLVGSINPLLGREAEVALLAAQVDEHRLITILGPGGSGKSRLAVEVARARTDADGPWFVELTALNEGSLLAETVSTAMGIPAAPDPVALAGVLEGRRLLLVLDNCEQVADDVSAFATSLLERCPGVRILATSRQTLGTTGEFIHVLGPLAEADAERLFLERAAAVAPQWVPDAEERAEVARVCRDLDGLPLAIELAAAQCRALSMQQIAEQLRNRFSLRAGGRPANRRHASMTAAIEWSYQSLDEEERTLFEALCLLEGSFDLEAVNAVNAVEGDGSRLQVLLSLIDKSLITVLQGSPRRRYRILETLRQYAAMHRSEAATGLTQRRIVTWVCTVAEQAEVESLGPRSHDWTERLDQDKDTIRAALSWSAADPVTYMRIAVGMAWFWFRRGHTAEGLRALQSVPAVDQRDGRSTTIPSSLLVRGKLGVVLLYYLSGDYARVVDELPRLKALASATEDEAAASYAVSVVAYFEAASGSIEQALADGRWALDVALRIESPPRACFALMAMAMAHLRAGELDQAERRAAEALAEADSCGFAWGAVSSIWIWCKARIAAGDVSEQTLNGAGRIVSDSAANRDITSWLVGIVCAAYVLFKRGHRAEAAELLGITHRQGQLIGFTPQVMDPVETNHFLTETMQGIAAADLITDFERGQTIDTEHAFDRVRQLIDLPSR